MKPVFRTLRVVKIMAKAGQLMYRQWAGGRKGLFGERFAWALDIRKTCFEACLGGQGLERDEG